MSSMGDVSNLGNDVFFRGTRHLDVLSMHIQLKCAKTTVSAQRLLIGPGIDTSIGER